MAGLLDFLMGDRSPSDSDSFQYANELGQARSRLEDAEVRIEELEESLLEIADAFDNRGWATGLDNGEALEMPLATVKKVSEVARAMNAINPFIKRGVNARISYIWGNGVEFEDISPEVEKAIRKNRKIAFSQQAYEERERAAATDGNVFTALNKDDFSMFRVPLGQITGSISNPDNDEEIWYYKREWKTKTKNGESGAEREVENKRWYPSMAYAQRIEDEGRSLPFRWNKIGVDQKHVMQHDAVNKQVGWRWGVPDILPVIFWAKAYKEYLEDNLTLVKAYSRIAWQIKAASEGSANAASAQWQSRPGRDPLTGERIQEVGATAVTGLNTTVVPTALPASSVDFSTGEPIASAIASGLEISLDVILSSSENSGAGSTLDLPTLKAMESRQKFWTNSFLDLFEFWGDDDAKVTWRNIDEDETHRRIQSVQLGYEGGLLHQEEARKEALELMRIVPSSEDMPVAPSIVAAEKAAENEERVAKASAVPAQGRSGSVGSVNSGRGQVRAAAKKSMVNK